MNEDDILRGYGVAVASQPRRREPATIPLARNGTVLEAIFWAQTEIFDGPRTDEIGPCRVWRGPRNRHGYGVLQIGYRRFAVHRVAYTVVNGPVPQGRLILHHCDHPPCCEPAHLYAGTHAQNMADLAQRGPRPLSPYEERRRQAISTSIPHRPDEMSSLPDLLAHRLSTED